ncbi:MAG: hypothetical protein JWO19_1332 [Bryobacterales bacterium]|nr:hypothetical protein [Bryobacterales bacterium]
MRCALIIAIAALQAWLAGCERRTTTTSETVTSDGQKSQAPPGVDAARHDRALIRFINADPAGKPRELWSLDTRVFSNVPYKGITAYVDVPTKVLQFRVRETDGPDNLITAREELFAGRHYTLIAIPRTDGTSILQKISDDLNQPKPGQAKIRVINATPGVDNLDLYRAGSNKKIEKGVDADASTGFKAVDPGVFEIRPARQPVAPRLTNLAVEANGFYTFLVVGRAGDLDVVRIEDKLNAERASN